MKNFLFLVFSCFLFFSCSHKTIPAKTSNVTVVTGNNSTASNSINNNNNNPAEVTATDTASVVNNNSAMAFLVVTNAYGKIVTGQDELPQNADVHFDAFQLSKGFSAQQLSNLKARYKTIPPRILYVNPQNEQRSARGTYYVLGKKFWYWKKKDGLFYLDEKYYL